MSNAAVVARRVGSGLALAGAVSFLALLYVRDPAEGHTYPPCLVHALTGLHCPGCGSLRALHQILHGHLSAAWGYNPLAVMCLPILGYAALSQLSVVLTGRRFRDPALPGRWTWTILVIVIAYSVTRNIPLYPFTVLAP